jgi:hypothetical protein
MSLDLRTVKQWLSHSDMESTMRDLKPSRSQQTFTETSSWGRRQQRTA